MGAMKPRAGNGPPGSGRAGFFPVRKLLIVLSGLRQAALLDVSVVYTLGLSAIVLAPAIWFRAWMDVLLVLVATGVMIVAELFNTALEALCDHIEAGENARIAVVKDIAAAAVGVSIVIWIVVVAAQCVNIVRAAGTGL